jgi:hypothetical protein
MRSVGNAVLLAVAAVALVPPAGASADYRAVIRDCNQDGKLDRHYSHADLAAALKNLPPDIAQYTDCRAVITAALRAFRPGGSCPGGNSTRIKGRKFHVRLYQPVHGRIVEADAYVDGKHVRHKKAHRVTCLAIRAPASKREFTVRIVARSSNGWTTTSVREYER